MISIKVFCMKTLVFSLIIISLLSSVNSVVIADDDYEEKAVKKKLNSFDASLSNSDISDIIAVVGKSFLGVEYQAGTLDKNTNEEKLIIMVSGLDCVTFVENVLAMSYIIKKGKTDIKIFKKE